MLSSQTSEQAKRAAAYAAMNLIENGMTLGLGTGSTVVYFIEALIEQCRTKKLQIKAVASSIRSAEQAKKGGIPLIDPDQALSLDLDIDGADEVDSQKRLIKGGGGALLREKIVAEMSREMIVIIDESKLVDQLGSFPLPVEIVHFAHQVTLNRIDQLGYKGKIRLTKENQLYLTDNGNLIIDIFSQKWLDPEKIERQLRSIPGVIETGFFLHHASKIIVGHPGGTSSMIE